MAEVKSIKQGNTCNTANKKTGRVYTRRVTDIEIEEALIASRGILTAACAWLAKHRGKQIRHQSLHERINKSEKLQQVRREVDEATLDFAESKLLELLNKGDKTAIIFYLKCKGKNRGYVERNEFVGRDGAPVQLTLVDIMTNANLAVKNNKKRSLDGEIELSDAERSDTC